VRRQFPNTQIVFSTSSGIPQHRRRCTLDSGVSSRNSKRDAVSVDSHGPLDMRMESANQPHRRDSGDNVHDCRRCEAGLADPSACERTVAIKRKPRSAVFELPGRPPRSEVLLRCCDPSASITQSRIGNLPPHDDPPPKCARRPSSAGSIRILTKAKTSAHFL